MERKEKQLLTITKITEMGPMNFNGGKVKGKRYEVDTAEGPNGQVWAMGAWSLEKNYPLNVPWYYDLVPKDYFGEPIWKFEVRGADTLTEQDKAYRRKVIASKQPVHEKDAVAKQPLRVERPEAPSAPSQDPDLRHMIVCATAYLAATMLASNEKEHIDEILPRALLMKSDIEYMINEKKKDRSGGLPDISTEHFDDDDVPF